MSTHLEQIRSNHELADLLELAVSEELYTKPHGQKAKTWQQHRIANIVNTLAKCNSELRAMYEDKEGTLKEEVAQMRGQDMFTSFYSSVNATREYHQRFPNLVIPDPLKSIPEVTVQFSGEEIFGKYLDLHDYLLRYCNLPGVPSRDQDYLQYLDKFNSFFYIPETCKTSRAYISYVEDLYGYLEGFLNRIQPLISIQEFIEEWKKTFDQKWALGTILGWKLNSKGGSSSSSSGGSGGGELRLGMFNDPSELEALGMDRLKSALEALGLKCGGTLADRAARLWAVRGKKPQDYPPQLLAKRKNDGSTISSASDSASNGGDHRKQIAWSEFKVTRITDLMMDIVTATRRHAEKQQARTAEEKEAEIREEELGLLPDVLEHGETHGGGGGAPDDEDEGPLYNPLNIPLGWDGKPIPYWLYKLHGLGIEFKCEICGNQSYWGRKAFDRHFQEWRHAHGMRCLGVPNTKHFHDITSINDALALYAKIKQDLTTEQFIEDLHEEFEDSEGNVLNRRTYEDLARQGLL